MNNPKKQPSAADARRPYVAPRLVSAPTLERLALACNGTASAFESCPSTASGTKGVNCTVECSS